MEDQQYKFTPNFCYFLGLMWADGWLRKTGNGIHIEIIEEDGIKIKQLMLNLGFRYHLRKFT